MWGGGGQGVGGGGGGDLGASLSVGLGGGAVRGKVYVCVGGSRGLVGAGEGMWVPACPTDRGTRTCCQPLGVAAWRYSLEWGIGL